MAVGVGMMIFLYSFPGNQEDHFVYRLGLIPLLIGAVLFGYSLRATPKE